MCRGTLGHYALDPRVAKAQPWAGIGEHLRCRNLVRKTRSCWFVTQAIPTLPCGGIVDWRRDQVTLFRTAAPD